MPKLKIIETEFEFSVEQYEVRKNSDWSKIRLGVKNRYMNYSQCGEMLQKYEVDAIIEMLDDLIYDRLTGEEELRFIEPDITMNLHPAHINVSDRRRLYRVGHNTSECCLDITWHWGCSQGYVDEAWTITLGRNKIMELLNGLKTECGMAEGACEHIGLVGVSFVGRYNDIHWYRYEGDQLWSGRFVKVEHDGKEEYGMVEYVRKYDTAHLPCKTDELKDIIEIVPDGKKRDELIDRWEKFGHTDNDEHALKMILGDDTEFTIESAGGKYRIIVNNDVIHYDITHYFCYGDVQGITDALALLVCGSLKEVTAVGTADPHLTFVLYPKGAKVIRDEGESFNYTDLQGNPIEQYYSNNTMKIELDLCIDGTFGEQFWSMQLSSDETENFVDQWVKKIREE